jgi:selenide,water dikinase
MTGAGRRLLLLGGGHAQLFVLEALAQGRISADTVTLVSSHASQLYSGMVPGLVEGRYGIDQLSFDLPALAAAAGAEWIEDRVTHLDAHARTATLASGRVLEYDVASLAIGGLAASTAIPGVQTHAHVVKPVDRAAELVPAMERAAQNAGPEPLQVAIVGAGAAGIELALTTRARLDRLGANRAILTLVDASSSLMRHAGGGVAEVVERELRRGEVTLRLATGVEEVGPAHLRLTGGRVLPADLVLWCAGVEAPSLFRESGLPVEARGFLTVHDTLAVPGTTGLYGAGDAVSLQYAPRTPKSGVHAVRQGPVLAHNIGLALQGPGGEQMGRRYFPKERTLTILNTGDGRAILSYSGVVTTGRWAMALKDRIDRRFMRRFRGLAAGTPVAAAS